MTVAALTDDRAQIAGDGVTDRVDLSFQFVDQNDLVVIHTDALGVDTAWIYQQSPGSWSFTGGDYGTGTVFFTAADLQPGERLTVYPTSGFAQAFSLGGEFDPATIARALDRMALNIQAIATRTNRALTVSPSTEGAFPNLELPDLQDGYTFMRQGDSMVPALLDSTAIASAVIVAQGHAQSASDSAGTASGHASTANTKAGEASGYADTASGAATASATARDKAQKWAEEVEDTEVETGKYSAKHWAAKAAQDASGVAANIAYDNQASGLTATDAQAAIDELASAPSNLLGDPEAANVEVMDQSDPSDPNEVFVTAGITTFREVGTLSPLLEVSSAGVVPYGPIYDRTGNELLAGFELAEQIIMSSQSVTIPANVNRVYMKVTGAGGGGSRFFGGAIQGSSAGTTTASVNGTTFQANGGTGAGSGPTTTYVYNGSHGGASGGTINTTGGGAAGGPPVSSGGRGGNGGYCEGEVTGITPGQSVSITIGAPGGGASTGGSASVSLVFRGGTL